jgi:hypothetical protein
MGPTVAVVGSAAGGRTYDPPIYDIDATTVAAEEIGRELANQGCRLVVFSNKADFIESAVVRGFACSDDAKPKSIEVRPPLKSALPGFPEMQLKPDLFEVRPEPTTDWEVSFYRSLLSVDALLLIGGGRSTFDAGLIALSRPIAIAPIATFGGAAEKAWKRAREESSLATEEDLAPLASQWRAGSAEAVVASLLHQHRRRLDEDRRRRDEMRADARRKIRGVLAAAVYLVLALASIPAFTKWGTGATVAVALLVFGPLLAGASGALIRDALFDEARTSLRDGVLGAAAGGLSGILFIAAQVVTNPDLLKGESASRLIYFVVPVGFAAGLAFDHVLAKLRRTDVTQTSPIEVPVAGHPQEPTQVRLTACE